MKSSPSGGWRRHTGRIRPHDPAIHSIVIEACDTSIRFSKTNTTGLPLAAHRLKRANFVGDGRSPWGGRTLATVRDAWVMSETGRASGRERVCGYVWIWVV